MNTAFFIIGGLVISYLVLSGKALKMSPNQWLALALSLLALNFARGGNFWMAGIFASIASYFYISGNSKNPVPEQIIASNAEIIKARSLLGIEAGADKNMINSAWRKSLSNHHPDRGGDADLAQRINQAREILLETLDTENLAENK